MTTSPHLDEAPPARARSRFLLQSVVVLLAVTACCMFAGLIADRRPVHIDATATREHRLSERTLDVLNRLQASPAVGDYELLVTLNSAAVDARAARRTRDVLDAFSRAAPRLRVETVDIGAADGMSRLDRSLSRVVEQNATEIARSRQAIESTLAAFPDLGVALESISTQLAAANEVAPDSPAPAPNVPPLKRFLADAAAICRLNAQDLTKAAESGRRALGSTIGRSPVPELDAAASVVRTPLAVLAERLTNLSSSVEATYGPASDSVPQVVKDKLRAVAPAIALTRDQALRLAEKLDALPRLPVFTVARVLERSSAAVVIGPARPSSPGQPAPRTVAAIDIDSLFPPPTSAGDRAPTPDLRARTEDLLGSALASLIDPPGPIIVFVHNGGRRISPDFEVMSQLAGRMRLRGIDLAEWAVAVDDQPPSLTALNGGLDRPVIYAVFYSSPNTVEGAARIVKLSRAVTELYKAGKALLISVTPSTVPALGQPDGMVEFLESAGLKVDSGRPLLHQVGTPALPSVSSDSFATPTGGTHPIDPAIRGLRLRLPWAVPLLPQPASTAIITPLVTVTDDGRSWAESQWMDFASIPENRQPAVRQQDQPKPDSARDQSKGPWIVAAAMERTEPDLAARQRIVVVGARYWFFDDAAFGATVVDNRVSLTNPGNIELFESAIYWLGGREGSIGTSPLAKSAPTIPNLSAGAIAAIRWALIAGLPALVLLTGAIWRLVRG